jgi:DNA repair protein RadC
MAITDWPMAERPREKLIKQGAASLSDAELLAIFLRTGVAGVSAVDLARNLLSEFGSLNQLLSADLSRFCAGKGLGSAKYAQLQAVMEMSRRYLFEDMAQRDNISSAASSQQYLMAQLRGEKREVFACLMLDSQYRAIAFEKLFYGTIDAASVYPREVLKQCMVHNAAAVIFAHNHPSGVAEPSQADRAITDRLVKALSLVDILVLDHFVIGDSGAVSFAQRGWL